MIDEVPAASSSHARGWLAYDSATRGLISYRWEVDSGRVTGLLSQAGMPDVRLDIQGPSSGTAQLAPGYMLDEASISTAWEE